VERLRQRGDLDSQLPALRAVGYRQAWMYLQGELAADEWVERALVATRQYAKRQLTWLRAEPDAHWVDPLAPRAVARVAALIEQAGAAAT
jgi:tRNA dimethylallyltransferase